uniref:3-carboxy-cis,cis-muconate cycloisomerase n=1 Tax=Pararhizobium sp. IMCC3301 TaxID=3067904 RepID=UPI0027411C52|nr:3-carboxy-cis,cis-muconate cycloisomerase [Pararhizobium sp. IMCC3301]
MFEDKLLGALLGDDAVSAAFSSAATLSHFRDFEIALTDALAGNCLLTSDTAAAIIAGCRSFVPDTERLRLDTMTDGLPVPAYIRQLKAHIGTPHADNVHLGATSQDLIDTALALALTEINAEFRSKISSLQENLQILNHSFGGNTLMGRTRMQAALPINVSQRIKAWLAPLQRHLERLQIVGPAVSVLQLGGAVGRRHAYGDKADAIAGQMAEALGLHNPPAAWHTERDNLANYANWLSLVTGSLGKMGQDVCLMAQQGIEEITLSGGGGSSAMPHKHNPIAAETLVTLARYNAVQLSAMHHALIHEQERSGSAWALEWMILPQMCEATACALTTALRLTGQVSGMGKRADQAGL